MKTSKPPNRDGYYRVRIDREVWTKLLDKGPTLEQAIRRLLGLKPTDVETRGRPPNGDCPSVVALHQDTWTALCKRALAYESPRATLRRELGLEPVKSRDRPRKKL